MIGDTAGEGTSHTGEIRGETRQLMCVVEPVLFGTSAGRHRHTGQGMTDPRSRVSFARGPQRIQHPQDLHGKG
jgi:hypothetical protein